MKHLCEKERMYWQDGTYGVCEVCHKEIDWARLEAKPYATLCIRCQQIREQGLA